MFPFDDVIMWCEETPRPDTLTIAKIIKICEDVNDRKVNSGSTCFKYFYIAILLIGENGFCKNNVFLVEVFVFYS